MARRQTFLADAGFPLDEQGGVAPHQARHHVHEDRHAGTFGNEVRQSRLRQRLRGEKTLLRQPPAFLQHRLDHVAHLLDRQAREQDRVTTLRHEPRMHLGIGAVGKHNRRGRIGMALQLVHLVFQRIRQKGLADDQHIGRLPNDPLPEVLARPRHLDKDVRPRQNGSEAAGAARNRGRQG